MKEISLKMSGKKNKSNSNDPVQFYSRNPFKLNDIKKKLMHFNFIKEIPLKKNDIKKKFNALQFY